MTQRYAHLAPEVGAEAVSMLDQPEHQLNTNSDTECTYAPKTKKTGAVFPYYHCSNGRKMHEREVNITEEAILHQLGGAIDKITIDKPTARRIMKVLNETHEEAKQQKKVQADQYRAAITAMEEREDRLYDRYDAGDIDRQTYQKQQARLRSEKAELFNKLEQANEAVDDQYLVTSQEVLELSTEAKILWESRSPAEQRDALAKVLWNPRLRGRTVEYDLRKPFAVLSRIRESKNWRPWRDESGTSTPACPMAELPGLADFRAAVMAMAA